MSKACVVEDELVGVDGSTLEVMAGISEMGRIALTWGTRKARSTDDYAAKCLSSLSVTACRAM